MSRRSPQGAGGFFTMARKKKKKTPAAKKPPTFKNQALSGLASLKDQVDQAQTTQPEAAPSTQAEAKPDSPSKDEQLFSQAMADVRPMGARPQPRPRPKSGLLRTVPVEQEEESEVLQALQELVDGQAGFSIHATDEAIEGMTDGLDRRLLKKLRKGEYAVQDHLDLHGLNRLAAREEVDRFLLNAALHGLRCVLVVHGRGHGSKDKIPVLKNELKTWFTRRGTRKLVLAFTTARPCDGGAGAVYVLLRKKKPLT